MANIKTTITKIRAGGQSGVDRAAMDFAKARDIPLCGWCPKNGWAEDYSEPPGLLADYPELEPTPSGDPAQRTTWNMRDTDAILTVMPEKKIVSPGTEVGVDEGKRLAKPMFTATGPADAEKLKKWLSALSVGTELCVGGPRNSEWPEAYAVTTALLDVVFDT